MTLLAAEVRRLWRVARSYRVDYLADFALYLVAFLFIVLLLRLASDSYGREGYLSTLLGYITWYIGANLMGAITVVAADESRTGTLEQLFLTGRPPALIFLSRAAGDILNRGLRGLLLGMVLAAILGVLRPVPPVAILVFLLTLAGAGGLGFAFAGLVLVYKQTDTLMGHLWQALLFFSGALAPIRQPVLAAAARLLPLGWGIECLRAVFLESATLVSLWQSGLLAGLLLNTAFYLLLGWGLFSWGQRQARTLGTLAQY